MIHSNVAACKRESIRSAAPGVHPLESPWPAYRPSDGAQKPKDHFIRKEGLEFAGSHFLVDLWGARKLDDLEWMENTFREAIEAAGATMLHLHLHHFTPQGGISGVAVLAESHISVHTWPERRFAAFDVFMCGDSKPEKAVQTIKNAFRPEKITVRECLRGVVAHD